ncbi:MAG TPA: hypothetical protein VJ305_05880 [Streptosporangiaceae bacterium]|nr:hypothetical protein [Streptosporangiaceae bacterium]
MRTMTPSRTQSQIRPEPDPLPAVGELLGWAVAAGVEALLVADGWLVGVAVTLGLDDTLALGLGADELALAETLALRVGEMLEIALLAASHPATVHTMARTAAKRTMLLVKRRMPDPSARAFLKQAALAAPCH